MHEVSKRLANQHILLTGGSGGLGTAVLQTLQAHGATLTLPAADESSAQVLRDQAGPSSRVMVADLRREGDVELIMQGIPTLDAVVHLMGGFTMCPTREFSAEQFRDHIDLNLTATFLVCKHALSAMDAKKRGTLITIGSKAALDPFAQGAAYCASKAGVIALTKAIAEETKGTGITANCILPSTIDTPQNRKAMGEAQAKAWVRPASIAELILFLLSDAGRQLRGAAIPIFADA